MKVCVVVEHFNQNPGTYSGNSPTRNTVNDKDKQGFKDKLEVIWYLKTNYLHRMNSFCNRKWDKRTKSMCVNINKTVGDSLANVSRSYSFEGGGLVPCNNIQYVE